MPSATAPTPSASSSPAASAPEPRRAPLAVYVHWPFCARKCPYCDFNSHVRKDVDAARFGAALVREIATTAAHHSGHVVTSIFFGGGTPSLMPADVVARVIDAVESAWPVADDVEITLEANPSSAEAARFAGYRAAGVNRLSLGVQALDDAALRFLGRLHDAKTALAALELALAVFPQVSADLIYARPGQTPDAWRAELARALALGTAHLSLYQLSIEPGTVFHRRAAAGAALAANPDRAADLYELTQEMTAAAGLPAYEISSHARPGAESRHNLAYWQAGPYAGIGPGAHGRLAAGDGRIDAIANHRRPERWLAAVEAEGLGRESAETIDPGTRAREAVMMGLRLVRGIDKTLFCARTGRPLAAVVDMEAVHRLAGAGFLADEPDRLAATAKGRPVLNALLRELLV